MSHFYTESFAPCIAGNFDQLQFLMPERMSHEYPLFPGLFLYASNTVDQRYLVVLKVLSLESMASLNGHPQMPPTSFASAASTPAFSTSVNDSMGVLTCSVIGCYFTPQDGHPPIFSRSFPVYFKFEQFRLHHLNKDATELFINGNVLQKARIELGYLRSGEDLSYLDNPQSVKISMMDIRGKRTAMFGKTRLGKSNVVKLVMQGLLEYSKNGLNLGQIVFDVNGEYANTNPQDGDNAIATAYPEHCIAYFITQMNGNASAKLLRFNFYERTTDVMEVIRELLPQDATEAPEVRSLLTVRLPSLMRLPEEHDVEYQRKLRKVMLFWAILDLAGFESDSDRIKEWIGSQGMPLPFNPGFSQTLRKAAYLGVNNTPPPSTPFNFKSMAMEMRIIAKFSQVYPNDPSLSPNGQFIFDGDEQLMVEFLNQNTGMGVSILRPCLQYHSPSASDFTTEILDAINAGKTVIINLGSSNEQIIRYFAKNICLSIFREQERKFVSNSMGQHHVQIYFEEAHMIFPPNSGDVINVYSRFAKEGAKFNIGIVYSTQSPTTVNRDLLSQTENFFIGHLSSEKETQYLSSVQAAFKGCERTIMNFRTPGLMHVLTHSHRYVIPVQAHRYDGKSRQVVTDLTLSLTD